MPFDFVQAEQRNRNMFLLLFRAVSRLRQMGGGGLQVDHPLIGGSGSWSVHFLY